MPLRLASLDDILGALDRLAADERARRHADAGRALLHCAGSVESSMRGYPGLKPAIVRGTVGKLAKRVFLRRGYMAHDTSADTPYGPALPKDTPLETGLERLRAALAEFRAYTGPLQPHVMYGACTRAEYERIHAMHVANHLDAIVGDQ